MTEPERQLQVLALHGCAVADTVDFEMALIATRNTGDDVLDHGARHAPLGARILGFVDRGNDHFVFLELDQNLVVDDKAQFTLRPLCGDRLPIDCRGDAFGNLNGSFTDTRHFLDLSDRYGGTATSEDVTEHLATYILFARLMVGHHTFRSGKDGDAEAVRDLRN